MVSNKKIIRASIGSGIILGLIAFISISLFGDMSPTNYGIMSGVSSFLIAFFGMKYGGKK